VKASEPFPPLESAAVTALAPDPPDDPDELLDPDDVAAHGAVVVVVDVPDGAVVDVVEVDEVLVLDVESRLAM